MLGPRRSLEQPPDLLDAQHVRKLARVAHQNEAPREVRPIQRDGEEEAQRRDRAVDRRRLDAALRLMNLEAADVLTRRGLRRPLEKGGKAPDKHDVVALGLRPQAAHGHVFEHAPAQRADGVLVRLEHRVWLRDEGDPSCSEPDPGSLNRP